MALGLSLKIYYYVALHTVLVNQANSLCGFFHSPNDDITIIIQFEDKHQVGTTQAELMFSDGKQNPCNTIGLYVYFYFLLSHMICEKQLAPRYFHVI